jgi:TolB-like protein/Flp pilus assembly protein TadD
MPEARVERRLAAIVAADVAGYSRLMSADEVGTLAALKAHRREIVDPEIAAHRGRIVKTTGDGMLVEFASAVDAVTCAVAVQQKMGEQTTEGSRVQFRVGINIGDIIVDGDDIFGDGVNVAARLEGIAEPGGICVSSSAYEQVCGKIPVDFTDLGEQSLKNIARPIRAYAVRLSANAHQAAPVPPSAPRLSIVVLPFANIGGDPEQDYFVDGVTESLTTDLSRVSGAFVISRNTAFTFKGKAVDVKKLGRELNVRYVLEGSVQRAGNRLRVNVQLIDAEAGNHLWAERFDKPVADLFDVQDEIVSRLANTLDSELIAAEARRAERSPHPDSMDFVFQGRAWWNKGLTPDYMARARAFFEQALALDPGSIEAMVGLAMVDAALGASVMTDEGSARFSAAEATLTTVLSLAPNHALAHSLLGLVLMYTKRGAQGIAECEHALALDRNLATAHNLIGLGKFLLGRGAETEAHINEAFRLSPRDPFAFRWMVSVAVAKAQLGADAEAVIWLRRALDANRNYSVAYFHLAAALAWLGELDEAGAAVRAGLALDPSFTVHRVRATKAWSDDPAFLAGRERTIRACVLQGCLRADVVATHEAGSGPSRHLAALQNFSFEFDRVRCGLVTLFLVRNWCGGGMFRPARLSSAGRGERAWGKAASCAREPSRSVSAHDFDPSCWISVPRRRHSVPGPAACRAGAMLDPHRGYAGSIGAPLPTWWYCAQRTVQPRCPISSAGGCDCARAASRSARCAALRRFDRLKA